MNLVDFSIVVICKEGFRVSIELWMMPRIHDEILLLYVYLLNCEMPVVSEALIRLDSNTLLQTT